MPLTSKLYLFVIEKKNEWDLNYLPFSSFVFAAPATAAVADDDDVALSADATDNDDEDDETASGATTIASDDNAITESSRAAF